MSGFPFHVAGGIIGAARTAFAAPQAAWPGEPSPAAAQRAAGSRRRRLWELPHKFHCPVIGVCFACDELRGLMAKVMHLARDADDYYLHTSAVGACEQRSPLAEVLHKALEKRYRLTVARFAALRDGAALRAAWRRACSEGVEVAAALWACCTHPALDPALEQEIFADIHMLQHQLGSGTRADLRAMQALRDENAGLRRQLAAAQAALEEARAGRDAAAQGAAREVAALRAELAAAASGSARLAGEVADLRRAQRDLPAREALAQRLNDVEAQAAALRRQAEALAQDAARWRERAAAAEAALATPPEAVAGICDRGVPVQLSGKCVLCVGGRLGAVDSYREVVEQSGGRFLHHDGGVEENLHRIDSAVAAADLVVCQVGCISHSAYWRVKEHCKRTGKPCLFVKNPGVSSFGRAVEAACVRDGEPSVP